MSSATDATPSILPLRLSTAVTATDHGQIIALVAWLCFTAGMLLSLVRLYIRWPLNRLAGKDDVTYAVSALFAVLQSAITINAVSKGLGQTESELEKGQVLDAAKVSQLQSVLQDMHSIHHYHLLTSVSDLLLGHLRNRPHLPSLHLDRQALRLLPLHPPCPGIEQVKTRLGSQHADIDIWCYFLHQCGHPFGYCAAMAL